MDIVKTGDGSDTIYSEVFGASYHSVHGAIQESRHIFIDAGLRYQMGRGDCPIHVLEIGLGTGLNAFLSYLWAQKQGLSISYTALEPFPIEVEQAKALNYVGQLGAEAFAGVFDAIHQSEWGNPVRLGLEDEAHAWVFNFTKLCERAEVVNFSTLFDVIYFDAFAPDVQPELWTDAMMDILYGLLNFGGVLTTYCAKGSVRRSMRQAGFEVEKLMGPPGKREITRAKKPIKMI